MTTTTATLDLALPAANDDGAAVQAPVIAAPVLCTWCGAERHTPFGLTPCHQCGHAVDAPTAREAA